MIIEYGKINPVLTDEQPQNESKDLTFPLFELPSDLQRLIIEMINQGDYATKSSFSWTCKKFDLGAQHFDGFAFVDTCIALGYAKLLQFSIDCGGTIDTTASMVAAKNDQVAILQMYCQKNNITPDEKPTPDIVKSWAEDALSQGKLNVVSWLKIEQWEDQNALQDMMGAAASGGLVEKVVELNKRKMEIEREKNDLLLRGHLSMSNRTAASGMFDAAVRLRDALGEKVSDASLRAGVFNFGCRTGHVGLVAESVDGNPDLHIDLLQRGRIGGWIDDVFSRGCIDLIKWFKSRGINAPIEERIKKKLDQKLLNNVSFEIIQYYHDIAGLETCPFQHKYFIPHWATRESLEWMICKGYKFDYHDAIIGAIAHNTAATEVIVWLLEQGVEVSSLDIAVAARHCRIDILEILWKAKPASLCPGLISDLTVLDRLAGMDMPIINQSRRYRALPYLRTFQWLLDKGYTWGTYVLEYNQWVCKLRDKKPRFYETYSHEIEALKIPET